MFLVRRRLCLCLPCCCEGFCVTLPRAAGSLSRGFDQQMDRNTFLSRQQKLDSDQNLLFMHHHETQRFSVSNLQQNGLVAFSVPSASVFLKSRFTGACQRVDVFPQPRSHGGAARSLALPGLLGTGTLSRWRLLLWGSSSAKVSRALCFVAFCLLSMCTNHKVKWELAVA